jgi:DOPA 4,5-dioxygenase
MNITSFHAHVYFDDATRTTAERVRDGLAHRFETKLGGLTDRAVGPHAKPMFQVTLAPEQFADVVPWLMLHRAGLSVLVHPLTGDEIADHATHAFWMGEVIPIDVEMLRRYVTKEGSR